MWQTVLGSLSDIDVEDALNAIGTEIDDAFHLDIQHLFTASVTLQQPVFMGGKIVAANQMAKLAEDLAKTQYEQQYRETTHKVDETYWQIVSISAKRELAENYDSLLHKMQRDVEIAVRVLLAHLIQNAQQLLAAQLLPFLVRHSDYSVYSAAAAFKNPNNGCFARSPATLAFLGLLALVFVLFSRFATNIGFIYFHNRFKSILVGFSTHCRPNEFQHTERTLVGLHTQLPL